MKQLTKQPTTRPSHDMTFSFLLIPKERLSVWEKVKGLWQNRKSDPIQEANKMRDEWDRLLPSLK